MCMVALVEEPWQWWSCFVFGAGVRCQCPRPGGWYGNWLEMLVGLRLVKVEVLCSCG